MDDKKIRAKVHTAVQQHCAAFGVQPTPYLAQRVLAAAHEGRKGTVKSKKPIVWVIAIVLMLTGAVAVAATLLNLHIEKAMDIAAEKGAFTDWTFDDKIALLDAMAEAGINLQQDKLTIIADTAYSTEERNRAATELLVSIYGSEEYISHFTIASQEWGNPFRWSLEQKEWFWETLRSKGLYTGKIKYLLPGEKDLSRERVVQLAKNAVQDAYHLSDDTMQSYEADVTFFTIEGTDIEPRWRVCLGYAEAEAADYEVLLTRDGQVAEDASLYIFKPEDLAAQQAQLEAQPMTVQTPAQKRMMAAEVLYISSNSGQYHFLLDCPSAPYEELAAVSNIAGYQPCPYCVQHTELWPAEDKIIYGVMGGTVPAENTLPEARVKQIAREHLLAKGMTDVKTLVAYCRYISTDGKSCYQVFFGRLENGLIEEVYLVIVDAENGELVKNIVELEGLG